MLPPPRSVATLGRGTSFLGHASKSGPSWLWFHCRTAAWPDVSSHLAPVTMLATTTLARHASYKVGVCARLVTPVVYKPRHVTRTVTTNAPPSATASMPTSAPSLYDPRTTSTRLRRRRAQLACGRCTATRGTMARVLTQATLAVCAQRLTGTATLPSTKSRTGHAPTPL